MATLAGDFETAEKLFTTESLATDHPDSQNLRSGLTGLALIAAGRGRHERALRLAGAESDLVGRNLLARNWRATVEDAVARCRVALGPEAADQAWEQGRRLSREDAIAYARDVRASERPPGNPEPASLTRAERVVADLAAAGATNAEIAEKLFVGRRNVELHLTNVYRKLGIAGRRELADLVRDERANQESAAALS
jgi:DNA-binding CsgD family transcriptional regulator